MRRPRTCKQNAARPATAGAFDPGRDNEQRSRGTPKESDPGISLRPPPSAHSGVAGTVSTHFHSCSDSHEKADDTDSSFGNDTAFEDDDDTDGVFAFVPRECLATCGPLTSRFKLH
jgi:hypothetical protein